MSAQIFGIVNAITHKKGCERKSERISKIVLIHRVRMKCEVGVKRERGEE
jgi:hypothetical protein